MFQVEKHRLPILESVKFWILYISTPYLLIPGVFRPALEILWFIIHAFLRMGRFIR